MATATAATGGAPGAGGAPSTAQHPKPLLDILSPTPPDIVIAQSVAPKHISQIAEAKLGLQPEEYELYGPTKAKVRSDLGRPPRRGRPHA